MKCHICFLILWICSIISIIPYSIQISTNLIIDIRLLVLISNILILIVFEYICSPYDEKVGFAGVFIISLFLL